MNELLFLVLVFLLLAWGMMQVTFLFYLAIMNAIRNKPNISKPAWVFIAPIALVGVIFDFLLNVVIMTVLFFDLPREFLFTKRLERYRTTQVGTRREKAACFICEKLLNAFDPKNKHC